MSITLYDLASKKGAWSPFVWRTRLALNYKCLAYKTHWLGFAEVDGAMKSIGAAPTGKRPDTGADLYTVPAVTIDGKVYVESQDIVEHLENAFPGSSPALLPPSTRALQSAFILFFTTQVFEPTARILVPGVPDIIDHEGAEYVRATRRAWFGTPLEEWAPLGSEKRTKAWETAEAGWGKLAAIYRKSEGVWLTGAEPAYADFVVLSALIFTSKTVLEDEWKAVLGWHDGIWAKLWKAGEKYMQEN